jgi:hypothetical protein
MLTKDQIIEGLGQLNQEDRDAVLDVLIQQLDEMEADSGRESPEIDADEWTAELDRRLERYHRGETVARSWEDVDAELERRLSRTGKRSAESQ